jgi:DNA primase
MYIDFQDLKQRVPVEQVMTMLGLALTWSADAKQWRGPCPRCKDGGDRALVVTPGKGYYCFSDKQGGDCIAFAAHILNVSMRDAAKHIAEHVNNDAPAPEPTPAEPTTEPLEPLVYLIYEHEAVQALGVDAEAAGTLGIGYAKKGIMRGRVAIPIRSEDGTLVGYCGYAPDADPPLKFPKSLRVS